MLAVGVDVGTQGVRAMAVRPDGTVAAQSRVTFATSNRVDLPSGWHEQSPEMWWQSAVTCLARLTADLGGLAREIRALAVVATSGTICLLDASGRPVLPALMYDDSRASSEVADVAASGVERANAGGYQFNASSALTKLVWLARHRPAEFAAAHYFAHAGDFVVGRLTGDYSMSDETQVLKTGYDLIHECWPIVIERELGIPLAKLPQVVCAGTIVGGLTPAVATATGLPLSTLVTAGATDGVAGQLAAGALEPGLLVSSLGTTLILKGVSKEPLRDPAGRIYCHRHPDGFWLPGGASNVGGGALNSRFLGADLASLDQRATNLAPTGLLIYPLPGRGERFPFVRPGATEFLIGEAASIEHLYAGYLEGVAYTERLGYEALAALGTLCCTQVYACGGAVKSEVWLQIRADVLGKEMLVTVHPEATFGAAIIAAAGCAGQSVNASAMAMARVQRRFKPRHEQKQRYEELYQRFRVACGERGWLEAPAPTA